MPFNSTTGADAGRKYGRKGAMARWGERDPDSIRSKALPLKVSADELAYITNKAERLGLSRAELIVRAIKAYQIEGETVDES